MYSVVIPVKSLDRAKTRLTGLQDSHRRQLAAAFLADVVSAALDADLGEVLVVTPDQTVHDLADSLGARARTVPGGINTAVASAPVRGTRAVLVSDLPALTADQLRAVLNRPHGRFFVADHTGAGTTLLVGDGIRARFGDSSAARHRALGVARVDLPVSGLTVDVDTWDDLEIARTLGVGTATERLLPALCGDPTRT